MIGIPNQLYSKILYFSETFVLLSGYDLDQDEAINHPKSEKIMVLKSSDLGLIIFVTIEKSTLKFKLFISKRERERKEMLSSYLETPNVMPLSLIRQLSTIL